MDDLFVPQTLEWGIDEGAGPDQGLPGGGGRPGHLPARPGRPVDPDWGFGEGGRPDQGLPGGPSRPGNPRPPHPGNRPPGSGLPEHPAHRPPWAGHPKPEWPPGPTDPDWGIDAPIDTPDHPAHLHGAQKAVRQKRLIILYRLWTVMNRLLVCRQALFGLRFRQMRRLANTLSSFGSAALDCAMAYSKSRNMKMARRIRGFLEKVANILVKDFHDRLFKDAHRSLVRAFRGLRLAPAVNLPNLSHLERVQSDKLGGAAR